MTSPSSNGTSVITKHHNPKRIGVTRVCCNIALKAVSVLNVLSMKGSDSHLPVVLFSKNLSSLLYITGVVKHSQP